jgi:hypothetical protein
MVLVARLLGVAEAASMDRSALPRKVQRLQARLRMARQSRPAAGAEAA